MNVNTLQNIGQDIACMVPDYSSGYDREMLIDFGLYLAIGRELVILGMSLGNGYLRDSILQGRRWLRNTISCH